MIPSSSTLTTVKNTLHRCSTSTTALSLMPLMKASTTGDVELTAIELLILLFLTQAVAHAARCSSRFNLKSVSYGRWTMVNPLPAHKVLNVLSLFRLAMARPIEVETGIVTRSATNIQSNSPYFSGKGRVQLWLTCSSSALWSMLRQCGDSLARGPRLLLRQRPAHHGLTQHVVDFLVLRDEREWIMNLKQCSLTDILQSPHRAFAEKVEGHLVGMSNDRRCGECWIQTVWQRHDGELLSARDTSIQIHSHAAGIVG
ncbi:hypothetical protein EDD18DRAFT_1113702 [Armillaria luteobubalina]|uniref:Uncharacterized protein n=1 Tax=Armillaria luteobubalina TaxID=153913 RepID=A0AA39P9P5_9AGAR|nr:hypothetical protein EDD18DRAFT_1113702 [Armillaria luteobubalina]